VTNDAASNGLSLSLTASSDSVATVTITHENSGSASHENTLFHGESVLIVAAGNLEDISLELITEVVTSDLLSHSLSEELKQFFVVINGNGLLAAGNWVRNV